MSNPQEAKQGTAAAFVAWGVSCILFGSALSVIKLIINEYDPVFLVFLRMGIAFLVLTPLALIFSRPFRIYRRFDLFLIILLSILDPVGFFTFEAIALQYTSATQASMLWAVYPMLNVFAAWAILKERTTRPIVVCFVIAMLGVLMLTAKSEVNEYASNPVLGNFLEILSLCCSAGFVIILRFLKGRYSTLFLVWIQCLITTIILLPVLFTGLVQLPDEFNPDSFLIVIYLALMVSVIGQCLSAYGIGRIKVSWAVSISNLMPVIGVLTGLILLGERMTNLQWIACAVVMGSVLVSQHLQRRDTKRENYSARANNIAARPSVQGQG